MLLRVEFALWLVNGDERYSSVYSLAWLVIVGVVGAVLGGWLGHLVARVRSKAAARIQELEAELESARGENSGYRREVFDQFAETARRFRSLDESYNSLHRQLAESASLLCGEAAGPLLEAPASTAAPLADVPQASKTAKVPEVTTAAEVPEVPETSEVEEVQKVQEESADATETVTEAPDEEVPILLAEVSESAPVSAPVNGEAAADGGAAADGKDLAAAAQDVTEPTSIVPGAPEPRRAGDAA